MNEMFLHFLWKYQLFHPELKTTDNVTVSILNPGMHNKNAGPDFFYSRLKIGDTLWAGNVEIHMKSSDWYQHMHHKDEKYDNVILHVVLEHNKTTVNSKEEIITIMEINHCIKGNIEEIYSNLMLNRFWIPCQQLICDVDPIHINSWIIKTMVERLERKGNEIKIILESVGKNWEETCFILIARHFGFGMNQQAFEMLARSISFKMIKRNCDQLLQTEALLFGQAGFLDQEFHDEYPNELKAEFQYIQKKLQLEPLKKYLWNFLRLRPANFPTIRLAQFAALIQHNESLFSKITDFKELANLLEMFQLHASVYWKSHFIFDKISKNHSSKSFGIGAIQNIIINVVVPLLFLYGDIKGKEELKERAMMVLDLLPSESNRIVNKWKELGIAVENATVSQGLLELNQQYCNKKKCLECRIGYYLLKD